MPTLFTQRHEAVLEIVLNRPEILNAVNRELITNSPLPPPKRARIARSGLSCYEVPGLIFVPGATSRCSAS